MIYERYSFQCWFTSSFSRTFIDPKPSRRLILDAVSCLTTAIISSLKWGIIRNRTFCLCFRRDVFRFLFKDSGRSVCRRPGKLYYRSDFCNEFFSESDFVYSNE